MCLETVIYAKMHLLPVYISFLSVIYFVLASSILAFIVLKYFIPLCAHLCKVHTLHSMSASQRTAWGVSSSMWNLGIKPRLGGSHFYQLSHLLLHRFYVS